MSRAVAFSASLFFVLLAATSARGQTYSFVSDFVAGTNSAANIWSYYYGVDFNNRTGSYTLQPAFAAQWPGNASLTGWYSGAGALDTGLVSYNSGRSDVGTVKPGEGLLHPAAVLGVAVGFKAPAAGNYQFNLTVANAESPGSGADGINWFLDRGGASGNLDSGTLVFSDGTITRSITTTLALNEFVYFGVTPRTGFSYDTTHFEMTVTAVPEPAGCAALLGAMGWGAAAIRRRTWRPNFLKRRPNAP